MSFLVIIPFLQYLHATGYPGCGKNPVFVSGHDFSRAVND